MPVQYTNRKGDRYTLHRTVAHLKSGQSRTLHFFSRDVRDGALDEIPAGYVISEAPSGMPVLKKG